MAFDPSPRFGLLVKELGTIRFVASWLRHRFLRGSENSTAKAERLARELGLEGGGPEARMRIRARAEGSVLSRLFLVASHHGGMGEGGEGIGREPRALIKPLIRPYLGLGAPHPLPPPQPP